MKLKDTGLTAQAFLDTIFQDRSPDEVICVSKAGEKDGKTLFWNMAPDHNVFTKWAPERQAQGWYFCVSTVSGEKNVKKTALRRRSSDVVAYYCLVLDDIGTKAVAPPVEPSWVIESSEGNYQWGYCLEPGSDFKTYEALVEWCHAQGWGDAGAGGCYRIMRIPGSANMKPGRNQFRSRVMWWEPSVIWTLGELASDLGADASELKVLAAGQKGKQVLVTAEGVEAKENIDILLKWLSDAGLLRSDDGTSFLQILCPWAEKHTSGSDTAGYSPLGRGDGEWVQRRGFRCLHEHCIGQTFQSFMAWAVKAGAPKVSGVDPLPWLQDTYTYIGFGQRVANLSQRLTGDRWMWALDDWSKMNKGRVMVPGRDQPVEISVAFLEDEKTTKVIDTQYWPVRASEDTALITVSGQELVNTYVPPNWLEVDQEPEIFLDHIDFLLPDDMERDLFLDWLAYKFQNPAKRSYAVVMVADGFGVGRSWLKTMLSKALQGKVESATLPQLIGKGTSAENTYNDWAVGCQFLVIEEAKDNMEKEDFYNGYETFKLRVDTRVVPLRVNPKYGRTRDDFMFFNALIFSNHSDAMAIPLDDRRICALSNPGARADATYYDALEASLDSSEPQRVYWYLMHRDLSSYDHVYPPMTPAKRAMAEQHRSPSDEIYEWIENNHSGDLLTRDALKSGVIAAAFKLDYSHISTTPGGVMRALWAKMGSLRDVKNGARYRVNGEQVEVRGIRDCEMWRNRDGDRDKELFAVELKKTGVFNTKQPE